jgi:3-hydroxybutyryl-CoA dehydrogenase
MKQRMTIGVVGAGTMGHGIAQYFATNSYTVILCDTAGSCLDKARDMIAGNLASMVDLGCLTPTGSQDAARKITYTTDLEEVARGSLYITEAVFEDLALKRELFRKLDASAPESVILASNTSSFDIDEIARDVARKERVIGTHWFHPPQITPCIEVIPSEKTAKSVVEKTVTLLESIGKAPTLCRSAPGFVANRIQYALVSEALAIVEEGLATPEQVDRIVKTSFGFRLSAFGPLEVCDQAGLDVYATIFKYFHSVFGRDVFKTPRILEQMAKKGNLGLKSGKGFYDYDADAANRVRRERDRKLYDRLRLFQKENGKK